MLIRRENTIGELSLPKLATEGSARRLSAAERQVVSLFDQFRAPLLRYAMSFGFDLATAQNDIATDWIAAYKKYFHVNEPNIAAQL